MEARDVFRPPALGRGGSQPPGVRLLGAGYGHGQGTLHRQKSHGALRLRNCSRAGSRAPAGRSGWEGKCGRKEGAQRQRVTMRRQEPPGLQTTRVAQLGAPEPCVCRVGRGPGEGQACWAEGACRRGGQSRPLTGPAPCGPPAGEASRSSWVSPLTPRLPLSSRRRAAPGQLGRAAPPEGGGGGLHPRRVTVSWQPHPPPVILVPAVHRGGCSRQALSGPAAAGEECQAVTSLRYRWGMPTRRTWIHRAGADGVYLESTGHRTDAPSRSALDSATRDLDPPGSREGQ
ncbi:uncharacterized protein [Sagmatias obliquidens]|uniref:uncharacterized protein n=1 Tax=Sagmatias obliquidens TaxID=3371155 RepID=UPI000F43F354|nr:uncharacterized protein LOC113631556 [Lagenorhynchus obliquidens]